ncbi:hypothetical protein QWZ08_15600 [Ferruginibacter paludis]|uniref:hypothetical protein n=1 Tax=Ferruginibacter paludis TaxID=1310417 RepID=UPI0025B38039|nr:hypothetical protein [Ferruginibacter paludis]MDN3657074.1 hypothetical protein [Ferruginibacter paludis]
MTKAITVAKVSFPVKYISNKFYISEVSVEGKHTRKFYFRISFYELYAAQVIRTGNCLTLLSTTFEITRDNFWNPHYFEDIARYVFWTFNKSFLLILSDKINGLTIAQLKRCHEILTHDLVPYQTTEGEEVADEELRWCHVKNHFLKKNKKHQQMYTLDQQNRSVLLQALTEQLEERLKSADEKKEIIEEPEFPTFEALLNPVNGGEAATLELIKQKVSEARFEFDIFSRIAKLPNGKNPYGLNSTISAVIDHFYQLGYFKKEADLKTIFRSYSVYTGNSIGKFNIFISEFRNEERYKKNMAKLKALKINKLS